MGRIRQQSVFIVNAVLLLVVGCSELYDHNYFSFQKSMEPTQYGRSSLPGVTGDTEVPVMYVLRRDDYVVYAELDLESIPPSAILYAESNHDTSLEIVVQPIFCKMNARPVLNAEQVKGGYPRYAYRITWRPPHEDVCGGIGEADMTNQLLDVSVIVSETQDAYMEQILFDILSNGSYREIDSL